MFMGCPETNTHTLLLPNSAEDCLVVNQVSAGTTIVARYEEATSLTSNEFETIAGSKDH